MAAVSPAQPLPMMMTLCTFCSLEIPLIHLRWPEMQRKKRLILASPEEPARPNLTAGAGKQQTQTVRQAFASPERLGDNAHSPYTTTRGELRVTRAPGTYAVLETSQGLIVCRLFEKEAPKTVEHFVGRAEVEAVILRRPGFPPGYTRFHDPGRMPAGHRHRRSGLFVRR